MTEYLDPYRSALKWHGPTFDVLLWRSPESQVRRFQALATLVPIAGRRIADLGCGRGDLLAWLLSGQIHPAAYLGVEALAELLGACETRAVASAGQAAGIGAEFLCADFAADADFFARLCRDHLLDTLVFSGSLNTFSPKAARGVLDRAWAALKARPGSALVFNFLSDRYPGRPDPGPTHRFDTLGLVKWAMERTPLVALRQDYLADHDATIAMRVPTTADLALP